ncbi:hypothetical protein SLA2020_440210 [Shorea laevis]
MVIMEPNCPELTKGSMVYAETESSAPLVVVSKAPAITPPSTLATLFRRFLLLVAYLRLRWRANPCPLFHHEVHCLELPWPWTWYGNEGSTFPNQDSQT